MSHCKLVLLLLFLGASSIGCVNTRYSWGNYEDTLYRHYRSPEEKAEYMGKLTDIVMDAEQSGKLVPPGIYAEYGFALYEVGDFGKAVIYFEKEQKMWPESRVIMQKMIRNANSRQKPAAS